MAKLISESMTITASVMVRGQEDDDNKKEQMLSNEVLDQLETILQELLAANGDQNVLIEITRNYTRA